MKWACGYKNSRRQDVPRDLCSDHLFWYKPQAQCHDTNLHLPFMCNVPFEKVLYVTCPQNNSILMMILMCYVNSALSNKLIIT